MSMPLHRPTLAWTLLMLAAPGLAAPASLPAAEASVAGKLRLVAMLLAQSPAVLRIPESGNQQAMQQLTEARAHFAQASTAAAALHHRDAAAQLDAALKLIVSASVLVPDPLHQAALERRRNSDLRATIDTLRQLHARMARRAGKTVATPHGMERVDAMLAQAAGLLAKGELSASNAVLSQAYPVMAALLASSLTPEPLIYDLKFDTPEEQFRHELAVCQAYEELIPIALEQLRASPASTALAQHELEQGRLLRINAQRHASGGAHAGAIAGILEATTRLQRALRALGLVVPTTLEGPP